jgi:heptosyltransferase I
MAVSTGTPVIGLYAHSNPKRTGPFTRQNLVVSVYEEVVQEQKGKSSCDLPWGLRVKGANLMERIEVPAVIARMSEIFSNQ